MALVDNCIFHSKLGSNAQVDTSEIGVNGVRTGTVGYAPGKFDNGVFDFTLANFVTYTAGNTSPQSGLIEMWWKPNFASTSAVFATLLSGGAVQRIGILWNGALKEFEYYVYDGAFKVRYTFTPVAFNAGDLIHMLFLYDSAGGAGVKLKVWQDTVPLALNLNLNDLTWAFGANIDFLLKSLGAGQDSNAVNDNLKIYNDITAPTIAAVFANKDNEGFPRWWVAPGASNWNNAANWSRTEGGAGGAGVPGPGNPAYFSDTSSAFDCTIDVNASMKELGTTTTYTGGTDAYGGRIIDGGFDVTVAGHLIINTGMFLTSTGHWMQTDTGDLRCAQITNTRIQHLEVAYSGKISTLENDVHCRKLTINSGTLRSGFGSMTIWANVNDAITIDSAANVQLGLKLNVGSNFTQKRIPTTGSLASMTDGIIKDNPTTLELTGDIDIPNGNFNTWRGILDVKANNITISKMEIGRLAFEATVKYGSGLIICTEINRRSGATGILNIWGQSAEIRISNHLHLTGLTWTRSAETLVFNGVGAQTVISLNQLLGNVTINSGSLVTWTDGLRCDDFDFICNGEITLAAADCHVVSNPSGNGTIHGTGGIATIYYRGTNTFSGVMDNAIWVNLDTPIPTLFAPIRPKVLIIGDVDIYDKGLVDGIGNITESRSFRKDKLIDNEIQIPVDNKSLYFSPENPVSPFNGANWYFSQVKVWDHDSIKIWDGLLWDIVRTSQGRTAKLISRSIMSKIKNIKVVYESADWETGPGALINIFAAADPPITEYNAKTFQDSINILTAAGALLKLKITAEDDMPLQSLVEKVAEYCAADAYSHLGEIRFKVWQKITGTGAISIVEKNVLKQPITQSALKEITNNYSIGYSGDEGIPATDSANGDIGAVSRSRYGERSLPELSTGDENEIVFKDKTTAVWIGEQYIKRTHRNIDTIPLPLIQSKYSVEGRLRNFLDLETVLSFTYSDEGFDEEIMEVLRFVRNNDKNIVDLITYTVAS